MFHDIQPFGHYASAQMKTGVCRQATAFRVKLHQGELSLATYGTKVVIAKLHNRNPLQL